jgi:N-acetylglucosaminyldiphosphoundecaprenol N-acetyl-beta-D-mannosaminyltransferase
MRLNAVKLLGISITNVSKNEILEEIQKYLTQHDKNNPKPLKIYTPNTEQLVRAHREPPFSDVLSRADISLPDTVGVAWASRILTKKGIQTPIPGVEFMEDLVQLAEKCRVPIGLIGGRDNLAVSALSCLRQKYDLLQDSWAEDGPEINIEKKDMIPDEEIYFQRLARRIKREGTRIVFVALGPPKQEYFIEDAAKALGSYTAVLMAVGGSFDIISGKLPRAPVWVRNIGFEWLWRLVLEPWRIRRQLALLEFAWMVCKEKWASATA